MSNLANDTLKGIMSKKVHYNKGNPTDRISTSKNPPIVLNNHI